MGGQFIYWEVVYHDLYLNDRYLMGSWVGREGKGYQAWSTYHLSPKSSIQVAVRNGKIANDFIPGGSTQWDWNVSADPLGAQETSRSNPSCSTKPGGCRCWPRPAKPTSLPRSS